MSELSEIDKIKQQVEQKLVKQQEKKEFKDVGRVAQTKKEKSAYKLISTSILTDLEQDPVMAYNMVKKENVWNPIDVNLQKEMGVSSGATFLKVKIRESAPTRPKNEVKKREAYVYFLENLQNDLSKCYTVKEIGDLAERYKKMTTEEVIANFIDPSILKENVETQEKLIQAIKTSGAYRVAFLYSYGLAAKLCEEVFGARFRNTLFRDSNAGNDIWVQASSKESISKSESEVLVADLLERKKRFTEANEEIIKKYKYMTETELRSAMRIEWKLSSASLDVYKKDIEAFRKFVFEFYERRIKNELARYEEKLKAVQPKSDDWSWFETPKEKSESVKEKNVAINTKSPLSYIKRIGGYKIEDISPKSVIENFGFSAVNYGVYVDDKWSKEHTKHFLGAMSDLGDILNINIKQVNDLGKLAIAFGAKGRKGHAAAYYSQTKDINLTKGNGDGSVAHEWGHYLDNVIVELDKKQATTKFASQGMMPDYDISQLFKEFMDFCRKGKDGVTPKVPFTFFAKKLNTAPTYYKYINYNWVSTPVVILNTIEETLSQYEDLMKVDYQNRIYSTQIKVFGYIINHFGLDSYEIPLKLGTSYFYHKSAYNRFDYSGFDDKGREVMVVSNRTKYWSSEVELFARAFETVILKMLLDAKRESNYLVADIPMDDVISETYFAPYPAGSELEHIENIIKRIIAQIQVKFNIGTFIPPSSIREDEYLDLSNNKKVGKVDNGMVIEKITPQQEEIVFVKDDKIVDVVETTKEAEEQAENVQDVIDGLEVLLETMEGAEKQELQDVIDGLKLLV
jgi:hypothetical protein